MTGALCGLKSSHWVMHVGNQPDRKAKLSARGGELTTLQLRNYARGGELGGYNHPGIRPAQPQATILLPTWQISCFVVTIANPLGVTIDPEPFFTVHTICAVARSFACSITCEW